MKGRKDKHGQTWMRQDKHVRTAPSVEFYGHAFQNELALENLAWECDGTETEEQLPCWHIDIIEYVGTRKY